MAFNFQLKKNEILGVDRAERYIVKAGGDTGGDITSKIRFIKHLSLENNTNPGTGKAVFTGSTITVSDLDVADECELLVIGK